MAKVQFVGVVLSLLAMRDSGFVSVCDQTLSQNVYCQVIGSGFHRQKVLGRQESAQTTYWGFPGENANLSQGSSAKSEANMAELCINCGGQDSYDLSNMNGYNLPMMILPSDGRCEPLDCTISNLNSFCQAPNVLTSAPGYGCKNTDGSNYYPTKGTEEFKKICPTSYSYFADDATSSFTCPTGSSYKVVFCPPSNHTSPPPPPPPPSPPPPTVLPPPAPPISPSPAPSIESGSDTTAVAGWKLGISLTAGIVFLIALLVFFFIVRGNVMSKANLSLEKDHDEGCCAAFRLLPGLLPPSGSGRFSYCNELQDLATNFFSTEIVGNTGNGTHVYEGALEPHGSSKVVEIKRVGASKQLQGDNLEFRAETFATITIGSDLYQSSSQAYSAIVARILLPARCASNARLRPPPRVDRGCFVTQRFLIGQRDCKHKT